MESKGGGVNDVAALILKLISWTIAYILDIQDPILKYTRDVSLLLKQEIRIYESTFI